MITLTSDFGDSDGYPGAMKGVISCRYNGKVVDITHTIPRHNIEKGAFVLMCVAKYYPDGTVHIGVVDPGVGTNRRGIVVKSNNHVFVGPDNGLLIPAARSIGNPTVYEIENTKFLLEDVSSTFHGRDVFAPVGAEIASGSRINKVGRKIKDFVRLEFDKWEEDENEIGGKVINVDRFGNIITNIPWKELKNLNFGDCLYINSIETQFKDCYGSADKGEMIVTVGGHGFLEVAVNRGEASKKIPIDSGEEIKIRKI